MKNIVNRALVAKKKQFQSKSVPRGTRTIWRYLGALFILFTFAIGNVWAADDVYYVMMYNSITEAGALTSSSSLSNGIVKYTSSTGKYASSTDITVTGMGSSKSSKYNNSSISNFTTVGNWAAGSGTAYAAGAKFTELTIGLGTKHASSIKFIGYRNTSSTSTMTIGEEEKATAKKPSTYGSDCLLEWTGDFTGDVSVSATGEHVGVFIITVPAGGGTAVCPSGLTISSKDSKTAFTEGDAIELTAALSAGNGDISYQWYKGGTAEGNKLTGKTTNKLQIASCTTSDAGDYFCVASKTSCLDAVNASAFAITVEADTKCFDMPAITSKPSSLPSVVVTGGTLSNVSVSGKTVAMDGNGLKFGGNDSRLKVTLTGASIIAGTKITVAWKGASAGSAGVGLFNENLASQVISVSGGEAAGSVSHTFTAEEAANYADEFIINRNASGSGICINAITVEDCGPAVTKHTVTLNYNDGETPNGSLTVVDGNAAVKPTDPTRGKYTFLGWFVGETDDEYVWSTAVTDHITLKAHWQDPWTLTFDADGGSAVANVTVKHNTKAEKPTDPTKDDNDFLGWFYGDPAVEFDWNANVTQNYALVAHWQPAVAKYDVEYYDGETKIGTEEQVWATAHPTAAGIETSKPLYTFVGWYLTSALEGDPVALNTVTPVEGLKFYGKWTKAYATSYDMEAYAVSDGATLETLLSNLDAAGYAYTNVNDIDNGHTHNYIYDGMKYKTNNGDLSFNVNAGKLVIVKTGNLPANALTMYINGVADPTVFVGANEAVETHVNNYFYSAVEALYRLDIQASKGTCAIKAVTITDPFTVSFDANGGDDVASLNGTPSVTLPLPVKGTESFLGWFDGETKVGMNGDKYTPTANITLKAHWEAVSTDARLASISFSSDAGTLSPAFDPEVTSYTYTMPYGTAAIPTITGATSVNAKAQDPIIGDAATAWGEAQTIQGVAQSGDKKTYTITMVKAPKDGVCLVWGDIPSNNTITYNATNSKVYKAAEVSLATTVNGKDGAAPSGVKFQNNNYVKVALNEGTFKAGDILALDVTYGTANKMYVYKAQSAAAADIIGELDGTTTPAGLNKVAITEDAATLWLVRAGQSGSWNPHVDYVAVYRIMNPELMAITIDGRAGEIDPLDDKHFNVQIPYEADLANLTIVPTIAWNAPAAENSIVVNDGGAWVEGNNTYKLTDKDGDYTVYTLTLTRDVLKHTVSFNTHGGSAVASVEVVDGQKLAAAPTDPTKEDYLFQGWSETDGGSIVDVTTITISADKEFHAVWAPDGAIKLLNGATVNHTNFITGVTADETVEFMGNEVHYAKFSGTVSGVNGVKDLTRVIAYNATTNKTKIQISAHNNSTSGRSILVKGLVEGASAAVDLATIDLGNKEDKVSEWIEFNNVANRTIYIMVSSSAGDVYFTQVKVIESGETPMKQAGEAGYSLNFNKGRFFGVKDVTAHFEGLDVEVASSDCAPLNTEVVKLNNTSMSFTVVTPLTLTVTTNNNKTYYVTEGAAGTDNETAKTGATDFDLTAGTWYITGGASNVEITNIAFAAPKCEKPTVVDMENIGLCEGDAFIDLNVSANVTDGGTLHYQWYKHPAEGDDEEVGTDAASYTPTADGQYYVVVTNKLAGYTDNAKTSNTVTVAHFASAAITTAPENQRKEAGQVATLTVVATGKAPLTYQWYKCDDEAGNNPVIIDGADEDTYEVTVTAAMSQYYKVVVGSGCGSAEAVAMVEEWHEVTPANVTGSITWNWAGSAWDGISGDIAFDNTGVEQLMANVSSKVPVSDAGNFRADMLYGSGQYVWRSGNKFFQGTKIRFITEVPGFLTVHYRNTSGSTNTRKIEVVNNSETLPEDGTSTTNNWKWTNKVFVQAGEVILNGIASEADGLTRIDQIVFNATPDYSRPVSNNIGTLCVDHNVPAGQYFGATFYQIVGRNQEYSYKIDFEEVLPNEELKAGEPYIFQSTTGRIDLFYGETVQSTPIAYKGMIGNYAASHLDITEENKADILYISQNKLWTCEDLVGVGLTLNEHRCYIKMSDVPEQNPGQQNNVRRRVTLGKNAEQVATGCENLNVSDKPVKMIINGQLFILRGEKMYDAKGQLVK